MTEEVDEVKTSESVTPTEPENTQGEPAVKPEASATPETDDPSAPPKKKGVGKRIDELVKQREQERREKDYWREQAQRREPKEEKVVIPEGEPKESDYNSYSEYLRALTKFELNQRISQERENSTKAEREYQAQQAIRSFDDKAEKLREQFDDFDDVAFGNFPVTKPMSEAILESDLGPEILYHLGNNPKEAARIARLSPFAAAREIGKLEAKLPELKKSASAAPAPITPVKPKSNASDLPSEADDTATWINKRRKQLRK